METLTKVTFSSTHPNSNHVSIISLVRQKIYKNGQHLLQCDIPTYVIGNLGCFKSTYNNKI